MIRIFVPVLTAAISLFVALSARADTRVAVPEFVGPSAGRVHSEVVVLLGEQSGVTLISREQIEEAAAKLKVDPDTAEGRIAISRELQLSAWMTGMVQKRGSKLKLTVAVYDGAQNTLVARTRLAGNSESRLSAAIKSKLWKKSRPALLRASTQVATEATDDAADESQEDGTETAAAPQPERRQSMAAADDAEEDGGDEPTEKKLESVRAFLGLGTPYRDLEYTSRLTSSLGDYRMAGAPMFDIHVAYHPAAAFTDNWLSWLALEVRGQFSLSTPTTDRRGNKFSSRYDAYHFGLRARMPVSNHYVSAFSGLAMSRLSIESENKAIAAPAPSIDYRMIRTGVGGEYSFSDAFMMGAEVSWLHLLGVGELGSWFPRANAAGFDFSASATYGITSGIFARVNASYQRTFFDFHARPGDKYIAGGATDQHLNVSVGAGLKL